ncbi:sugar transferase [Mycolicibacterium litorale]|uniref:Undecaprenyl-phosphate glucose phosphotransferase n=1 Tax=Mycolicibacterium litorale TaxID=758802 RepID=A0AAD1IGJ4_9MYCO|nr:sugar transferase [Mycolicibacterium litorale]MCV7413826.1 sugar transferase [Mycolicibacterium litorale]TDY03290.1 exopolysaccharide biosynthesis polyprenyl glycosylphosphotransferase [Mycolicibacterium litorale]BBY15084.1 undecaprenyl-phosphate glucose phosphotransferase [Mycolicibacterium litorale]
MTSSSQATVPRQRVASLSVRNQAVTAPRWVERMRAESGYIAITVALDVWGAAWAVVLAHLWIGNQQDNRNVLLISWLFVPVVVIVLATRSMYKRKLNRSFLDELEPVETAVAVAALTTLAIITVLVPAWQPGEQVVPHVRPSDLMIRIWLCAAVVMPAVRLMRSIAQRYLRRKYRFGTPALIVGGGPITNQLITRMAQVPDYGLRPVGVLDEVRPTDAEPLDVPYLGTIDNFEVAVRATGAEDLIVAPSAVPGEQLTRCAQVAQSLGMRVRVVPRMMDVVNAHTRIEHLGGVPLMVLEPVDPKGWQFAVKHALGKAIAAVVLLLISPLFLGLALLVKLSSPGPIFFRQPRVGRDGKVFDCLKFRSMRPAAPADATFELKEGAAPGGVEGDDRRTRIGKIMRKTSLDELPQLLSVVKGDMALVGPRPERPEFVELFEMHVRRYGERHRVKAGITGWSQVHGLRGQTSIADRAEFDNYYIENWSLLLDLKILLLTVLAVLRPTED